VVIGVELGPIECDVNILASAYRERNPAFKEIANHDATIAEKAIHLLYRVFRIEPLGLCEPLPKWREHPEWRRELCLSPVGQRQHPHRVEVIAHQLLDKSMDILWAQSVLGQRFAQFCSWGCGFLAHLPDILQLPCG